MIIIYMCSICYWVRVSLTNERMFNLFDGQELGVMKLKYLFLKSSLSFSAGRLLEFVDSLSFH